jgi:uncharacterized protein YggE
MKRIALFASLLIFTAAPALAQEAPQVATLTADGTGVVLAEPDIVVISIGVTTRGTTPSEALQTNSSDMQNVINAILDAGVDEADVATSGFSISPIYADQQPEDGDQPPAIVGYNVSNQVTVRIRDIASSGDVLDKVVAAGANQINGIRFDIAEPGPLQDEATQAAIADARRRAELMADAAGVRLVRVLTVSTYANNQPQFDLVRATAVPIMGGQQAITATATLVFEIAPE